MKFAGFVGPTYAVQSQSANAERCINLYPQTDESGSGKNVAYLFSTPGLKRFATLAGIGGVRGEYTTSSERLFVVVASSLLEVSSTGATIGTYPLPNETGTGIVSMTDNGTDMMIATGPNGYWFHLANNDSISTATIAAGGSGWTVGDTFTIAGGTTTAQGTVSTVDSSGAVTGIAVSSAGAGYTNGSGIATTANYPSAGTGLTLNLVVLAANTLTQITDEVFQGATACGFIDGYIVYNQPNTQVFWITNLYSTTINPLGFASAEGSPDNLVTLLVDHREIWLFGDITTEVWYDSGNSNFPFAAIQGAFISHGIVATWSAARLDNTVFWLGNDEFGRGIVYRANGYAPVRVSNFAVEQAMQRYPTITDAVAWTYQQDGHAFYVLNFPSGDVTWVYDAASGMWHERAYLGTSLVNDGQLHRGRPQTHSFAFGKHIVGDWEKGYLYELTPLVADDDTRQVSRIRRAPYIDDELKRVFYGQFQLDMEVGMGNPSANEPVMPPAEPVDPQISLRWSDDGGYTWSAYKQLSIGKSGQYRKRVIWRRLGRSRQRVFEVSTSQHGLTLAMYDAYMILTEGVS